jgi:hypothetical protein
MAKGQPTKVGQSPSGDADGQGRCQETTQHVEVRGMRSAEALLGVIRDRGRRGLPLERMYRLLFNRDLFLLAYGRIAKNRGALTPGTTDETADGMSLAKLDTIIEALRFERYRWTPVRRVHIPKAKGETRPLGIPMCRSHCTFLQAG